MSTTAQSTYHVMRELGRGQMAIVYLAQNRINSQLCVLKVFYSLTGGASALHLINREAQIQRRLDHPGIVRVSGVAQDVVIPNNPGRYHALIMEYVAGQDLASYLQRKQKFSVAETVRICLQICRALEHAHSKGVIHRDIKPQNILVRNDGVVKITDFGFASATSASILSLSGVVGTPYYMSPEQADGASGDQRSDIYAVGVMMYEMLCGKAPFQGNHPSVVIEKHRTETPKRLSECNPSIPVRLDDFVLKALEKKPNDRFHSAGEMATILERIASELGVPIQTSSWIERASAFWGKSVENLIANMTWWVFSVTVAFMVAVMAYQPTTLQDASRILVSILDIPGSPVFAATQDPQNISPLLTAEAFDEVAPAVAMPTPRPTATRTPKPAATKTTRMRSTPTFTRTPRPIATKTPTPEPLAQSESNDSFHLNCREWSASYEGYRLKWDCNREGKVVFFLITPGGTQFTDESAFYTAQRDSWVRIPGWPFQIYIYADQADGGGAHIHGYYCGCD